MQAAILPALPVAAQESGAPVVVGSKKFTESVILAETVTQLLQAEGFAASHRDQLGGTRFLWNALRSGEIDVYPEYTGTLIQEIFVRESLRTPEQLRLALAEAGIRMTAPLGFNNTYALGMKEARAAELGIRSISDLRRHPALRFGFSNEFMDRQDGWPGLRDRYGLPQQNVRGLDHDLAYRGLETGAIDLTDLYSTDAEIAYYGLRVLEDNAGYFPPYEAVLLYRADLAERATGAEQVLKRLEDAVSGKEMVQMNAQAKIDHIPEGQVAAHFINGAFGLDLDTDGQQTSRAGRLWTYTREHLYLVLLSLSAAILLAIPLGIAAAKRPRFGQFILGAVGVIYPIPSLALLVFMIPLLGIGGPPALVALFLYSLLPIVRNTHAGLHDIPGALRESADALGLPPGPKLWRIELPLASRSILAGIKTSAVINIGTATLGALIGAGGYGQPILTGIRLDNVGLILEGAVPAALLALVVQGAFEWAERRIIPKGLRL